MKPGYKTSEFWLSLATTIVGTLMASGAIADNSALAKIGGTVMTVLSQLGYTYNRYKLKSPE